MSNYQSSLVVIIIDIYGLALDDNQADAILQTWFQQYEPAWVFKAIVESLYRGRYKLVSVDNILKDWQRIGTPRYNFTPEYEREILHKIPNLDKVLDSEARSAENRGEFDAPITIATASIESVGTESYYIFMPVDRSVASSTQNLNPEESAPFSYHHDAVAGSKTSIPHSVPIANTVGVVTEEPNLTGGKCTLSASLPAESGSLQSKTQVHHFLPHEPIRQNLRPVKRRLFNILKEIVDPKNHYAAIEESVAVLPQALGHHAAGHTSPL